MTNFQVFYALNRIIYVKKIKYPAPRHPGPRQSRCSFQGDEAQPPTGSIAFHPRFNSRVIFFINKGTISVKFPSYSM